IVVRGARAADVGKQLYHGVLRHSGNANCCANRAALNQAANHLGAGLIVQVIHIDSYTIAALACQEKYDGACKKNAKMGAYKILKPLWQGAYGATILGV